MVVQNLTRGSDDGATYGQSSTDKISFYGATPIVRPTSIAVITAGATTTQCNAAVISVMAALNSLGLVPSA